MKMKWTVAAAGVILAPLSSHAQASHATMEPIPQISVAAQHEIKVQPDRATIQISVQTRAVTAAAAGAENATRLQAVLAALRAQGLTNDQLSTANYNIYPDYRHEQGKEPQIIGYNVTNTIVADVRDLRKVGPVIDAALRAGANMMSSLQFYASNTEEARRTGIAAAITKARGDAEAAARAAGGSLGPLLEIGIGNFPSVPPQPMMMKQSMTEARADTPIQPGEETLMVMVSTRWRFNPGR